MGRLTTPKQKKSNPYSIDIGTADITKSRLLNGEHDNFSSPLAFAMQRNFATKVGVTDEHVISFDSGTGKVKLIGHISDEAKAVEQAFDDGKIVKPCKVRIELWY